MATTQTVPARNTGAGVSGATGGDEEGFCDCGYPIHPPSVPCGGDEYEGSDYRNEAGEFLMSASEARREASIDAQNDEEEDYE